MSLLSEKIRDQNQNQNTTDAADLVGQGRKTPAFVVEDMKVADGSNLFKGLTIITLSSLIPPLLRLNLIVLAQKPLPRHHTHARTHTPFFLLTKVELIMF